MVRGKTVDLSKTPRVALALKHRRAIHDYGLSYKPYDEVECIELSIWDEMENQLKKHHDRELELARLKGGSNDVRVVE